MAEHLSELAKQPHPQSRRSRASSQDGTLAHPSAHTARGPGHLPRTRAPAQSHKSSVPKSRIHSWSSSQTARSLSVALQQRTPAPSATSLAMAPMAAMAARGASALGRADGRSIAGAKDGTEVMIGPEVLDRSARVGFLASGLSPTSGDGAHEVRSGGREGRRAYGKEIARVRVGARHARRSADNSCQKRGGEVATRRGDQLGDLQVVQ